MIAAGTPVHQPSNSTLGNMGEIDPYTLAAVNPYSLGLDPYQAAALLQQQQQLMYMQQQQAVLQMAATSKDGTVTTTTKGVAVPSVGASSSSAVPTQEVPTDPTYYYKDFWSYAAYYGEAAARTYYGGWAPPVGTLAAADITLPGAASDGTTTGNATITAAADSSTSSVTADPASAVNAVHTTDNSTSAADHGNTQSAFIDSIEPSTNGAQLNDGQDPQQSQQKVIDVSKDPAGAHAVWESYKQQYADWYERYGRAAGADRTPAPAQFV